MATYVDELRDYQEWGRHPAGLWCHLVTDGSLDELHEFAARLGISPRRFQNHPRHPHYDLMPGSRAMAVVLGAIEVSTGDLRQILAHKTGDAKGANDPLHSITPK